MNKIFRSSEITVQLTTYMHISVVAKSQSSWQLLCRFPWQWNHSPVDKPCTLILWHWKWNHSPIDNFCRFLWHLNHGPADKLCTFRWHWNHSQVDNLFRFRWQWFGWQNVRTFRWQWNQSINNFCRFRWQWNHSPVWVDTLFCVQISVAVINLTKLMHISVAMKSQSSWQLCRFFVAVESRSI